jgi:hypothetical protein
MRGLVVVRSSRNAGARIALVALASVALGRALPASGSDKLKRPQEVDIDPDRFMSFGRLSKAPFDKSINQPYLEGTNLPSMDPSVEPYNWTVKPSRYDPQTGTIQGGIVEKEKEMRELEAEDRPARPTSPAGIYRAEKTFTAGGNYVRPPTPLTLGGLKEPSLDSNKYSRDILRPAWIPPPDFQPSSGEDQSQQLLPGVHVAPPLNFLQEGQNLQLEQLLSDIKQRNK